VKTYPLPETHSEQLTPSPTPTPPSNTPNFERPAGWFSRSKTTPIPRSPMKEDFPQTPTPVQPRLSAKEEYEQLPQRRKSAAGARVAEMKTFLSNTQASERFSLGARALHIPKEEAWVRKRLATRRRIHKVYENAISGVDATSASPDDDLPPLRQDILWLSINAITYPSITLANPNAVPTCRICAEAFELKSRDRALRIHGYRGVGHAVHVACLGKSDWSEKFNNGEDWCERCEAWREMCTLHVGLEEANRRLRRAKWLLFG